MASRSNYQFEFVHSRTYFLLCSYFESWGLSVHDSRPVSRSGSVYAESLDMTIFLPMNRDSDRDILAERLIAEGVDAEIRQIMLSDLATDVYSSDLGDFLELSEDFILIPSLWNVSLVCQLLCNSYDLGPGDNYPRVSCLNRKIVGSSLELGDFINTPSHMKRCGCERIIQSTGFKLRRSGDIDHFGNWHELIQRFFSQTENHFS